jgi:beta-lactamase regulating signal transducer with metallopeptidase domain
VIATWMLYALLMSTLLAAAAWLMEGAVRLRGGPARLPWLLALAATAALVATAPLRVAAPVVLLAASTATPAAEAAPAGAGEWTDAAMRMLDGVRGALAWPLEAAAGLGGGAAGTALGIGWLALSAATLALAVATLMRARRMRRGWPAARIAGEAVRVAPAAGPAVLGILRPQVVIPAWLLAAPEDEQRLVVMHEREHVRARDPLLLAGGWLAVAMVPWSPAAWWMLLRLRAAVELDCDARVLRRGVARRAYGTLLIEMAGRGPGLSLGAPALAGSPSTLERRIRSMNARLPRFARLRAGLLAALGLMLMAGACDTPLPTSAEVQRMDARALEGRVGALQVTSPDDTPTEYFIDGKAATREEAMALPADRIVRMEVTRASTTAADGSLNATGSRQVHLYTAASPDASGTVLGNLRASTREPQRIEVRMAGAAQSETSFDGLVVIDGQVRDHAALRALSPDAIQSIDVLKGAAATTQYDDARAAAGVIRITTKAAAPNP